MALGFIPKMMRYTKLMRIRRLFLSRRPVSSIDSIRFTACIPDGMIDLWRHLAPDMIYFPRSTLLNVILPNIWSRNLSLLIMKLITIDATRADIVFRTLQDEWVRNLTIMRARWRAKSVVHWYKKPQVSHPEFEFPVADLMGFYPKLYNVVSQVQDQVVSHNLRCRTCLPLNAIISRLDSDYSMLVHNQIFGRFALEFPCMASYPHRR